MPSGKFFTLSVPVCTSAKWELQGHLDFMVHLRLFLMLWQHAWQKQLKEGLVWLLVSGDTAIMEEAW